MLFCVFGNSGAGKDTIINTLIEDQYVGMKTYPEDYSISPLFERLKLATTRPPRFNEQIDPRTGKCNYYFLTKTEFFSSDLIEYRGYHVANSNEWYYGTLVEDLVRALISPDVYFATCTPKQFRYYWEFAKNVLGADFRNKLYPIFISVPNNKIRLMRLLDRSDGSIEDIKETCRRFAMDEEYIYDSQVPDQFKVINDDISDCAFAIMNLIDTFSSKMDNKIISDWDIDCTCPDTFGCLLG